MQDFFCDILLSEGRLGLEDKKEQKTYLNRAEFYF